MEDNSMRSIGVKYIPVDKVTKANLQRLARLEGKPLGYYLRDFAANELKDKPMPLDIGSQKGDRGQVSKKELNELRSEIHNTLAVILAMPFMPILNKPGEWQTTIESLTSGMAEVEDILASKLAELPGEARQFIAVILDKSNKYEESKQGELIL